MRVMFAVVGVSAVAGFHQCDNDRSCPDTSNCVPSDPKDGLEYGCVSAGFTVCSDKRFSCPDKSRCDVIGFECVPPSGGLPTPLNNNSAAERTAQSNFEDLCTVIEGDLPSFCTCDHRQFGGRLECDVSFLGLDTIGLAVDLAVCGDDLHANVEVVESALGIDYKVAGISSDSMTDIPVPGLSVGIPKIGNAGVNVAINLHGTASSLTAKIGLDACAKILGLKVCGGNLLPVLPIWILDGTWQLPSSICNDPSTTLAPTASLEEYTVV